MAQLGQALLVGCITVLNVVLCIAPGNVSPPATNPKNDTANSLDIICTRPDFGFLMDSFTAKRLSSVFCDGLLANFPRLIGDNYSAPGYPRDLAPTPGHPDYLEMEQSGLIAELEFVRRTGEIIDNTILTFGTTQQCLRDNCTNIFDSIINMCEWNSHSLGGYNTAVTDCGIYALFIQNCTNNLVDWNCRRWHRQYPPRFTASPVITAPPTTTTLLTSTTIMGLSYTSVFAMTTVTQAGGGTTMLPLTPSTVERGNVTVVPFTPSGGLLEVKVTTHGAPTGRG